MANTAPITIEQLFRFYRGLPHQMAAIVMLEEDIRENGYAVAMRRDRPWFLVWSQDGKQEDANAWLAPARAIVQQFEGCELTAYPDPGTGGEPWTIGWGATRIMGRAVRPGETITQGQADAQLEQDLRRFHASMVTVLPIARSWSANRQAALVSFAFNTGIGALEGSTLRKRLLAKEDPNLVVSEELPRWTKGGGGTVLAGLVRRRAAEVALFGSGGPGAALQAAGAAVSTPAVKRPPSVLLKVPYFSQLDNGPTGYRECFSSSCAMVAAFWGKVRGDDEYNRIRAGFGDTTDAQAQIAALRKLGLKAEFHTDGTPGDLERELNAGRPVAVGWLHYGLIAAPVGDGHWTCLVGHTPTHWIMNDPYGEADLVKGGYLGNRNGAGLHYSRKNWNPRWMVKGTGGWFVTCSS